VDSKRIILAGGGTGGHIFPAIAIANALKKLRGNTEILFIGALGKMEMEKVPQAGYRIEGIDIAGFNRSSLIKNIGLPYKLAKSFWQVRNIIRSFRPDAVIGVGGYSSFPVLRYAQSIGIPSFFHESNAFAGKANRMLGKKATRIFTAVEGMEKFFPADKILVTGNPVRASIVNSRVSREEGLRFFGLSPDLKTVLSTGGSLGAKSINEAVEAGLNEFEKNNLQLIWQTGKPFEAKAQEAVKGRSNVWTKDFISGMEYAFAAADIVISRSGAMSLAELCVVKKPAVLVPYPFAAEDHQTVNARFLVDRDAALIVSDSQAGKSLISELMGLARDSTKQKVLSENISRLAVPDADQRIASEIFQTIG
jgi:UDP-N-acetylglucosamine--N-acetylmuramyl-(pentapeptide) pyrophosphoryl-undecaprenol N-acetylglucosamine transferase